METKELDAKPAESSSTSEVIDTKEVTQTQVDEKSTVTSQENNNGPFHENPRFKELISEKNQYKTDSERYRMDAEKYRNEVETLRRQDSRGYETSKQPDVFESAVEELIALGMDKSNAVRYVKQQVNIAQAITNQQVAPLIQNQQGTNLKMAVDSFAEQHKDYPDYKTKISDMFSNLSPEGKNWIMNDLQKGLKYLYLEAKSSDIDRIEKESLEKGRNEAYDKKQEKSALSRSNSSRADGVSTDWDYFKKPVDLEDYAKKKKEFDRKEAEELGVIFRG